jgi:membrane-bound lytic murein transglycosylase B
MVNHRHLFFIALLSLLGGLFSLGIVYAQEAEAQVPSREQLEQDLAKLEAEIKTLNGTIAKTQEEKNSLARDIKLLEQRIAASKLEIKLYDSKIKNLSRTITEKDKSLRSLSSKMEREKDSLAQIMRKAQYMDSYTVVDFMLQTESLSTFYSDKDSFSTLKRALNKSFEDIRTTQSQIQNVKSDLEDAKDEETQKKLAKEAEKKKVETNQKEKNTLLTITKNKETEYKKVLANREKEAASIRARLFELRDSEAIPFGQAYDLALAASKTTGVRPALILAILMQESTLGVNVGSCFVRDYTTGTGIGIRTGETKLRTMNPTRDVPVFINLMKELGRDPQNTQVSCWITAYSGGEPVGWGGAMGPSQFIPSTWILFKERIQRITGSAVANPWNAFHAITATALYLQDLGAVSGYEVGERNAACKYYSGRSCSSSRAGANYGNAVMKKMYAMQADIDKLQGQ